MPTAYSLLAFGDSLTAGYGIGARQSFAAQLEAALVAGGIPATVHNAGVSGDTTAAGLARLPKVLAGLAAKPNLVILELGANDMLFGVSPARTRANLDAMLAEFTRLDIPVLLAGMLAAPMHEEGYIAAFNAIFPGLAKQHGVPLYPFFMEGLVEDRSLRMHDGVHPTADGVAVIVRGILPMVKAALGAP